MTDDIESPPAKILAFFTEAVRTGPPSKRTPKIEVHILNNKTPVGEYQFEGVIHATWVRGELREDKDGKYITFVDNQGVEIAKGHALLRRFNFPPCLKLQIGRDPKVFTVDVQSNVDVSSFARKESFWTAIDESFKREYYAS